MSKEGVHLYMGKVKPAMKEKTDEGKLFYDCWFMLEGKGANVKVAVTEAANILLLSCIRWKTY
jgi:hypothetical protein